MRIDSRKYRPGIVFNLAVEMQHSIDHEAVPLDSDVGGVFRLVRAAKASVPISKRMARGHADTPIVVIRA
jgi:hypothetical protein